MTTTADALLLTPEEAARRMSLSRSSLYELLLAGEVASLKIGRSRRVPLEALKDYIGRKLRDGALDRLDDSRQ